MIKNLIVNGCSFTQHYKWGVPDDYTWGRVLATHLGVDNFHNLAQQAAGNFYIYNSTVDFLTESSLDPAETLVIVMWSGTNRRDFRVTGDWHQVFKDTYPLTKEIEIPNIGPEYYICSTPGEYKNKTVDNLFNSQYRLMDPELLCRESLTHFINLENFLKVSGYRYRFASYANYWNPSVPNCTLSGDYSIGQFCSRLNLYKNFNFSNWVFVDQNKNCFMEWASERNLMDETTHPNPQAHQEFAQSVLLPSL